jgi:hypothetical protein
LSIHPLPISIGEKKVQIKLVAYRYSLKIHKIRNQQIRESCGIQPINEWVERRKITEEWDQHVRRMDAERLVKISRNDVLF